MSSLYRVYQKTTFTVESGSNEIVAECADEATADRICDLLNAAEVRTLLAEGERLQDILLPQIKEMQRPVDDTYLPVKAAEADKPNKFEAEAAKRRTDYVYFFST